MVSARKIKYPAWLDSARYLLGLAQLGKFQLELNSNIYSIFPPFFVFINSDFYLLSGVGIRGQWLLAVGCRLDSGGFESQPSHSFSLFSQKKKTKID